MVRRRFPILLKFLLFAAVVAVIAFFARGLWLPVIGRALVHNDAPVKADVAIVLGGDAFGHRIEKAAELVKQGYVPMVLVSGPDGFYGFNEADVAIPFIVRKGYPAAWFAAVPNSTHSTKEEAVAMLNEMRRRNVHSFLLVTSDFHSARAGRIYKAASAAMGYAPEMHVVDSPDENFHADSWWHSREGQKTVFMEYAKTISTALGN